MMDIQLTPIYKDSIKRKGGTSELQQCSPWYSVAFMGLLFLAAEGFCFTAPTSHSTFLLNFQECYFVIDVVGELWF